jgi:hypothetical protein
MRRTALHVESVKGPDGSVIIGPARGFGRKKLTGIPSSAVVGELSHATTPHERIE